MSSMVNQLSSSRPTFPVSKRAAAGLLACLLLSGCGIGDWFSGDDDGSKLGGNRISVLQLDRQLEVDAQVSALQVELPPAEANADWSQPGRTPTHAIGHLALPDTLREAWSVSIEGNGTGTRLLSGPIIAGGRVYVLDTDYDLHALDEKTGRSVWVRNMRREGQEGEALGGGVTFGEGRLYVTTGFGEALAVNPDNGDVIWRQKIAGPIRSAPVVAGGRVFVVASDNQLITLAADSRVLQWFHTGLVESAALLGGSSVAVEGDTVVVPYSSGEVYALRVENGRQNWQDSLSTLRRGATLSSLSDIRGLPVIDRGQVFAVSYSGRMAAIDLRTGQRVWEQDVGGLTTPAIVGDWVFVTTSDSQVVALTRNSGRVRWMSQLAQYEDPEDRKDPIIWSGPLVAGGRLILVSSTGEMVEMSPADGAVIRKRELPDPVTVPPVVANNTLYILTTDGELVAYR